MRIFSKLSFNKSNFLIRFVVLFLSAGLLSCSAPKSEQKWEFSDALPIPENQPKVCFPPNSHESSQLETAASVIELGIVGESNFLDIGAQQFLASTLTRTENGKTLFVCTPSSILKRVSDALNTRQGFGKGRLTEYGLTLVSKLPEKNNHMMEDVAEVAFNTNVQPSDTFSFRDIRPYARTTLASFGKSASKYGKIAYKQISVDTPMGTGAAQVAAATGYLNALPRIVKLMEIELESIPTGMAIPIKMRNRLHEMSLAIYFSGDEGKKYTKPIHEIMHRKVQSSGLALGIADTEPKELCDVLRRIEGDKAIEVYNFCMD